MDAERIESEHFDVAIVGYGPVGGTLANLLARQGLNVAVVEPYTRIYPTPRAGALVAESIRLLQVIGLADQLVPGMAEWIVNLAVFDKDWNLIVNGHGVVEDAHEFGWPQWFLFIQPELEAAVRQSNERLGVRAYLGYRATEIEQGVNGVEVRLRAVEASPHETENGFERSEASGAPRRVHADWVVGCDGANSTVRDTIGGGYEDFEGDESWLLIHLRVTRPDVKMPLRGEGEILATGGAFQWLNPDRHVTFVTGFPQGIHIFEFKVLPGETVEELTATDRVWELLSPWVSEGDAELIRVVVYDFHSRVANIWRDRRILLAGDAAHVMPPDLGQGLNSGFRDVMNLGWKLAGVIRGNLKEEILDSYAPERRPQCRALVELSNLLATTYSRITENPDSDFAKAGLGRVFAHPWPRVNPGIHGDAPEPVGLMSAQPTLADGTKLDDAVGYRFAVIGDDQLLADAGVASDAVWAALDTMIIGTSDPAIREWLDRLGCEAIVVRPDRLIFGLAANAEELRIHAAKLGELVPEHALADMAQSGRR